MKYCFLVFFAIQFAVLSSCSSTMPIYNFYPAGHANAEKEAGILLVSSKLQVMSIDGKDAGRKGRDGTVFRLVHGTHRIKAKVAFVDTMDFDLMGGKYYSSGAKDIDVTIRRDYIHNLQVMFAREKAWLEMISGKNPLILKDGSTLSFSVENRKIELKKGDKRKEYDLLTNSMSFSPDGTRAAFLAFNRGAWVAYFTMVLDGIEGEQIGNLVKSYWSPDSRHFAYVATGLMLNRPIYVVVDYARSDPYDSILNASKFFFTPEGKFCYAAEKDSVWHLVRGDIRQKMASREDAAAALEAINKNR